MYTAHQKQKKKEISTATRSIESNASSPALQILWLSIGSFFFYYFLKQNLSQVYMEFQLFKLNRVQFMGFSETTKNEANFQIDCCSVFSCIVRPFVDFSVPL